MEKERLYKENGEPRFIRCYETKRNPTVDRFTVVFTRANVWGGKRYEGRVVYVSMSGNPFSPQGVCCHDEVEWQRFCPCGSRITFAELPKDCQEVVLRDYKDLWEAEK